MKFCIFLALTLLVVVCAAQQSELENAELTEPMDKRIPHPNPSWRSRVRVRQFQPAQIPTYSSRFVSFNGPRRFYRYARRPFSFDFNE